MRVPGKTAVVLWSGVPGTTPDLPATIENHNAYNLDMTPMGGLMRHPDIKYLGGCGWTNDAGNVWETLSDMLVRAIDVNEVQEMLLLVDKSVTDYRDGAGLAKIRAEDLGPFETTVQWSTELPALRDRMREKPEFPKAITIYHRSSVDLELCGALRARIIDRLEMGKSKTRINGQMVEGFGRFHIIQCFACRMSLADCSKGGRRRARQMAEENLRETERIQQMYLQDTADMGSGYTASQIPALPGTTGKGGYPTGTQLQSGLTASQALAATQAQSGSMYPGSLGLKVGERNAARNIITGLGAISE